MVASAKPASRATSLVVTAPRPRSRMMRAVASIRRSRVLSAIPLRLAPGSWLLPTQPEHRGIVPHGEAEDEDAVRDVPGAGVGAVFDSHAQADLDDDQDQDGDGEVEEGAVADGCV